MKKPKLKKCPFCGSHKVGVCRKDSFSHFSGPKVAIFVRCDVCRSRGTMAFSYERVVDIPELQTRAINSWNTRIIS